MPEFEQPLLQQERPESANRARLAQAASVILKDVPTGTTDLGWATAMLMGTPNEDIQVLRMIAHGRRLQETGEGMAYEEIEEQSGMRVDILDPVTRIEIKRNRSGFLFSLDGIGQEDVTGLRMPIIKGRAVMRNYQGEDEFIPVGVLRNGTVFKIPEKPAE